MKTKRYVAGLAVVGGLALTLPLAAARVGAQDVPPLVATGQFGLMGAVRGQIVRLNVTNINLLPPDPYRATIEFVDANGDALMRPDGTPVRRDVVLGSGESAFVQFHVSALLTGNNTRLVFRPVLKVVPPDPNAPPDPYVPPDPFVPSVEIIDADTLQTHFVVPGSFRSYSSNHNETLVEDR